MTKISPKTQLKASQKMSKKIPTAKKYVVLFGSENCLDAQLVGGKAASLAKMMQNGFPVPDGFALSTRAFYDFCKWNEIDFIEPQKDCRALAEAIQRGYFPPELEKEVDEAVEGMAEPGISGGFAVRSSAVGEDGHADSMAGQLQTFLYVEKDAVKDRIKECWAALFDERAQSYRLGKNIEFNPGMGVAVQRQIDPLYAGVLFSVDPRLKTADHIVLEWVEGIGDRLVSGEVVPERVFVHRKNPVLVESVGEPLMSLLQSVIDISFKAEKLFRHPVDVEWCATEDEVYILQSRPITTLTGKGTELFANVNIGENYPEPLSPFTWSIVESFRSWYFHALFKRLGLSKCSIDEAESVIDNLVGVQGGMVYYNLGNWYEMMALFPFGSLFREFLDHYIGQSVPIAYEPKREHLRIFIEPKFMFYRAWFWTRLLLNYLSLNRQVDKFERKFYERRGGWRNAPLDEIGLDELEAIILDIRSFLKNDWGGGALADFSAMVFPGLLSAIVNKWRPKTLESQKQLQTPGDKAPALGYDDKRHEKPANASCYEKQHLAVANASCDKNQTERALGVELDDNQTERASKSRPDERLAEDGIGDVTVARFLQGLSLKSAEPLKSIWVISCKIDAEPELKKMLLEGDYNSLESTVNSDYPEINALVSIFMDRFGGRCYHELMITSPTFEERTDLFWDLVKGYILSPERDPFVKEKKEHQERERFTREYLRKMSVFRRPVMKKVLRDAQSAVRHREKARLCQSLIYGELRRTIMELGKRLADKGYLETKDDVFYLELKELLNLIEGKYLYPEIIQSIIVVRKKAYLSHENFDPPEFCVTKKGEYCVNAVDDSDNSSSSAKVFRGLGVSRGFVKGRAKVILNPAEQNRLEPGEILVTRTTDPGWTPLFLVAGGLVLEKGGLLSHGAIVAREFGIPAIVGVKGITDIITDGQQLYLNGDTGEIKLLSETPPGDCDEES